MQVPLLTTEVGQALDKIYRETSPLSIFVYGSRSRTDFRPDSDYEIGVLYPTERMQKRSKLMSMHQVKEMVIYPFSADELAKYNIDTPFPQALYLRDLITTSKTVFGEEVLEKMEVPEIRTTDLLESASFEVATAFCAVRSYRTGDLKTATINYRSALFGARILEILALQKYPTTYDAMVELAGSLVLKPEYYQLLANVKATRTGVAIEEGLLFTNISFLNQEVLGGVRRELQANGDKVVLTGKKIIW